MVNLEALAEEAVQKSLQILFDICGGYLARGLQGHLVGRGVDNFLQGIAQKEETAYFQCTGWWTLSTAAAANYPHLNVLQQIVHIVQFTQLPQLSNSLPAIKKKTHAKRKTT